MLKYRRVFPYRQLIYNLHEYATAYKQKLKQLSNSKNFILIEKPTYFITKPSKKLQS